MAIVTGAQAKKYFSYPTMLKYFIYTIIAALVLGYLKIWAGLAVALIIAGLIFKFGMTDVPTDQDIEDTYANFAIQREDSALTALNIQKSDLIRSTDWFWSVSGGIQGHEKRYRKGSDDIQRANTRSFLLVLYAENQIMSYEVDYNIEAEVVSKANNSEWFYKDVVGVEVGPDDRSGQNGEMFILRTSGGAKYFPLSNNTSQDAADEDKPRQVMNSIRTMLREKKA